MGHNHRHNEGQVEYPGGRAETADYLAQRMLGHHIAIPHRGPGDGGEPKRMGYAGEIAVHISRLGVVDGCAEEDHAQGDGQEQAVEFLAGRLEGEPQYLQPVGVAAEFDYAKYP